VFNLNEEIKQSQFTSNRHELSVNILHTASWYKAIHTAFFKPYGLTPNQFNVLRILRGQQPNACSLQTVSERMVDKNSNTGRIIDRLLEKKMVSRCENKQDRRQVDLSISTRGLEVLAQIDAKTSEMSAVMDNLNDSEVETLNKLLNKLKNKK
jgi:DNA-binding MarR family transcriptional regulator